MCCVCGKRLKPSEAVWLAPGALAGGARVRCRDSACAAAIDRLIERQRRESGQRVRKLYGRVEQLRRGVLKRQGFGYMAHPRKERSR